MYQPPRTSRNDGGSRIDNSISIWWCDRVSVGSLRYLHLWRFVYILHARLLCMKTLHISSDSNNGFFIVPRPFPSFSSCLRYLACRPSSQVHLVHHPFEPSCLISISSGVELSMRADKRTLHLFYIQLITTLSLHHGFHHLLHTTTIPELPLHLLQHSRRH